MKTPDQLHEESLDPNSNNVNVYNDWAKTYDNYVDSLDYMGPKNIVKNLIKLLENNDKILQILDFGCGTGKVGEELKTQLNNSYYLEGIDISQNMLKNAGKKNVYNDLTCIDLTKENYNKKFDIILSSGVFLEGHVNINNISRLQKLLNKNGILLFTIRETFKDSNSDDFYNYVLSNKNFISYSIIDIEYLKNIKCKLVIMRV
jgi:predicted TPR repeat methyltransferase